MDLMIDLETLDTSPTAVVLSLGAVAFDPYGEVNSWTFPFYVEFTNFLEQQTGVGRTISPSTVLWWMGQNAAAREVFKPKETSDVRCSPLWGLNAFNDYLKPLDIKRVWARDPDFDIVILRSLYQTNAPDLAFPFSYSAGRSVRTVEGMPFAPLRDKPPVAHNALEDAINQAYSVQEVFAALKTRFEGRAAPQTEGL